MDFTPAPTLLSSLVALLRKRAPQPTFTLAVPAVPTQVFVTSDTMTYVDPPIYKSFANASHAPMGDKPRVSIAPLHCSLTSEKLQHTFPDTPRAPHCTTFTLPVHDWNTAELVNRQRYEDRASYYEDLDVPSGYEHLCRSAEYAVPEPKTLAKMLFFFGFLFPPFWIAGFAIMLMPLRPTRDWEQGKSSNEIEVRCTAIRVTELKWATRCLVAFVSEVIAILLVIGIVKLGIMSPV